MKTWLTFRTQFGRFFTIFAVERPKNRLYMKKRFFSQDFSLNALLLDEKNVERILFLII